MKIRVVLKNALAVYEHGIRAVGMSVHKPFCVVGGDFHPFQNVIDSLDGITQLLGCMLQGFTAHGLTGLHEHYGQSYHKH